MPPRTKKPKQELPKSLVSILGFCHPTNLDIPEEYKPKNLDEPGKGEIYVLLKDNTPVLFKRDGVNLGLDATIIDELIKVLYDESGFEVINPEVIKVLSGDGQHIGDYSVQDGRSVSSFVRNVYGVNSPEYNKFHGL